MHANGKDARESSRGPGRLLQSVQKKLQDTDATTTAENRPLPTSNQQRKCSSTINRACHARMSNVNKKIWS